MTFEGRLRGNDISIYNLRFAVKMRAMFDTLVSREKFILLGTIRTALRYPKRKGQLIN